MKNTRVPRINACRAAAMEMILHPNTTIAFVCRNDDHRRMINEYFTAVWNEIPDWMKPELMVRNTRQLKFANGSMIRLVLRPDYLKGVTYSVIYTYGPAADVDITLCRPGMAIFELRD